MSETYGVCPLADENLIKKAKEDYNRLKNLQLKEYNKDLDDLYPLLDILVKYMEK